MAAVVCLQAITSRGQQFGPDPAQAIVKFSNFAVPTAREAAPAGWFTWAPRPEIEPHFSVDQRGGRQGRGALRIDGQKNPAAFGSWRYQVDGIVPGGTYRLTAYYRTRRMDFPERCAIARLDWLGEDGRRVSQPDYAMDTSEKGLWTQAKVIATAPEKSRRAIIELSMGWCAQGTVWWDDIQLWKDPVPRPRVARVVTIHHRPSAAKTPAENVEQFCRLVQSTAAEKPDLVCLPEGITVIGTGKSYIEAGEPVPGPTTKRLGELSRELGCYIVAGIYERAGPIVYNTAVLMGRKGELAGTYRKTHLPREEVEAGITPGDSYPVFSTDFGKIGIMICWDLQFAETACALAKQGAEMILLPIWGGSEVLARARAIENHVYLVTSSYDMRTFIVDPTGKVLAEATAEKPIAFATIDLQQAIIQPWLGNMKARTWKERRPDIPMP
ncbi:MAG: carbon-nitrogen hydrolase family protein [Candidatus Omnitrophica bacterium]|nr:carbon-nitrogen hydrolase family protein [Candidatus Omnitrophota bacterium]